MRRPASTHPVTGLPDADQQRRGGGACRKRGGLVDSLLIGIAGGLLGGRLGKVIFGVDSIDGFFELSTWIAAIVGSLILL
ncbi:hypothetical protein ABZ669_39225, partial [Streptomyces hirsutus]